jgi:hypothetical protein
MRIALSGMLSRSRRLLAQLCGSFGAPYSPNRRFSVFGELGLNFRSAPLDGHNGLDDPLSRVRVPRGRSPDGRTSAVALAEPNDRRDDVNAVGRLPFSN